MTEAPIATSYNKPAPAPAPTPLGKILAGEIAVSTVANILMNLLFTWLVFPTDASVSLWGLPGVAIDLVPATVVPAVMMTFVVTAILRSRVGKGLRAVVPAAPVGLPDPILLRAIAIGLLALLLVALPTLALLSLIWTRDWSWDELIMFKLGFSFFHALVITPIVVLAALRRAVPA